MIISYDRGNIAGRDRELSKRGSGGSAVFGKSEDEDESEPQELKRGKTFPLRRIFSNKKGGFEHGRRMRQPK